LLLYVVREEAVTSGVVQYVVYNGMLRRGKGNAMYEAFQDWGNVFGTTIHVLQSAVVKIARVTKLAEGLKLYRGLSMYFPEHFLRADAQGRRGVAEWGFMSTSTKREVRRI
jgi:hypothetical protein